MNDFILCSWCWDGKVGVAEFHCVGDDLTLGVSIHKFETAVGIHGGADVGAILGTKIPRASGCRFGMDEDPTTYRT